jgi:predicted RNA-binding protein with PUA-like domain
MNYWIIKSEAETYSIDQMKKDTRTWWTGVRNYQARNFMMNEMKLGDLCFFYHSNAEPPGIAGLVKVCAPATPDESALDKKSEYHDPKATHEKPIWHCVQVEFVEKYANFLSLANLRSNVKLSKMVLLQKGSRLSIQPVSSAEFSEIIKMIG